MKLSIVLGSLFFVCFSWATGGGGGGHVVENALQVLTLAQDRLGMPNLTAQQLQNMDLSQLGIELPLQNGGRVLVNKFDLNDVLFATDRFDAVRLVKSPNTPDLEVKLELGHKSHFYSTDAINAAEFLSPEQLKIAIDALKGTKGNWQPLPLKRR